MTGRFEGIFLDFYGTVAGGDHQAVRDVCQRVIDDHNLTADAGDLAGWWGDCYFAAIESVNGHAFRLLREIEHETLIETALRMLSTEIDATPYIEQLNAYLACPQLFEEVHEVLSCLRLPVCIVSNADEHEIRQAIAHHGLKVDYVVTSESARSYKPEPGIFRSALELTGWSPDRVLHVGDSLHSDVGGAHKAGLRAAWVRRAVRIKDIGDEEPEYTWGDLRPLLSL
ncbi:MAG TPA: HAD family hydrolase [Phycisphaerae bacterium]|nr:HAD family hydrolase [Phycisphaerae bacterium]